MVHFCLEGGGEEGGEGRVLVHSGPFQGPSILVSIFDTHIIGYNTCLQDRIKILRKEGAREKT